MKIVYFLLFPLEEKLLKGEATRLKSLKRGPYFLDIYIDIESRGKKETRILGKKVLTDTLVYDGSILLFQSVYDIGDDLNDGILEHKNDINARIRKSVLSKYGSKEGAIEEYTALLVDKPGKISDFVEKHHYLLAKFIRSVEKNISKSDADEILVSRVSYSEEDLVIVDWEGAVVIDSEGDFESQLELIKIGNYQLLRYRILDKMVQKSLEDIRKSISDRRRRVLRNTFLRTAIENRLSLLLDFDKVDQSLLLVGDWYSAKLYKKIMEEFYIDDWRSLVRNKLVNLETIDATTRNNLVFNWGRALDIIQIIGWMVLLVGYFFLYYIDLKALR